MPLEIVSVITTACTTMLATLEPLLPLLCTLVGLLIIIRAPLPGRGPRTQKRDGWRSFKYQLRADILQRAGNRCESARFVVWRRCDAAATQVDHIYPWSRGGPTITSNAQAICASHNRRKGARTPAWWYVLGLEHRRRGYSPSHTAARVVAHPPRPEVHTRTR